MSLTALTINYMQPFLSALEQGTQKQGLRCVLPFSEHSSNTIDLCYVYIILSNFNFIIHFILFKLEIIKQKQFIIRGIKALIILIYHCFSNLLISMNFSSSETCFIQFLTDVCLSNRMSSLLQALLLLIIGLFLSPLHFQSSSLTICKPFRLTTSFTSNMLLTI